MADPYASFGTYAPPQAQPPPGGGYEAFTEYRAPVPKPAREISPGESAERGAISAATFGFNPALSGVAAAGEGAQPIGGKVASDPSS